MASLLGRSIFLSALLTLTLASDHHHHLGTINDLINQQAELNKYIFDMIEEKIEQQEVALEDKIAALEGRLQEVESRPPQDINIPEDASDAAKRTELRLTTPKKTDKPETTSEQDPTNKKATTTEATTTITTTQPTTMKATTMKATTTIPTTMKATTTLPTTMNAATTLPTTMKATTTLPTAMKAATMKASTLKAATEKTTTMRAIPEEATTMRATTEKATDMKATTLKATTTVTITPPTTKTATTATATPPTITMKNTTTPTTPLASTTTKGPKFHASCAEIYDEGYRNSGEYPIDPDGLGPLAPFTAYCDMETGEGVTMVGHEHEDGFIDVNGFDKPGRFVLEMVYNYDITIQQLAALADISTECRQYAKYACKSSSLMEVDPRWGITYAWWTDRNGDKRVNWAGAPTDSAQCACGVTGTCFNGSPTCNCDHRKAKNQLDEGYFDDKDLLPIMSIHLGDTGSKKERGALTVGKLICRGKLA